MTDKVDEIVLRLNDQKWPVTEAQIREYGQEQYRLGFLDGEASVKPSRFVELTDVIEGCAV